MNSSIEQLQSAYTEYLKNHEFKGNPSNLYDPMNYIMSLGGKRIRPVLALMGNQIGNGNLEHSLPIGHVMEVFHNFSLVHDDIMDRANIRRGKPTVHKKWDEPTAILVGDNMLVKCFEILLNYSGPHKHEITAAFAKTATEVCEGQQNDMDFGLSSDVVSEESYFHMIEQKTAVLLGCSIQCGFLSSGGSPFIAEKLREFAIDMGLAFQLRDDYLDSFGSEAEIGKKQGGDILEKKNTWLFIESMNLVPSKTLEAFQLEGDERIAAVLTLWKEIGLDQLMLGKIQEYHRKSELLLKEIENHGYNIELLDSLSKWLLQRNS
jgi:geranylgeranyl diphosphate synthase type II